MVNPNPANLQNTPQRNREIEQMPNIRVFYQKTGRAKYISHLDITRCMQRSLKRAGIPVWYTQGFNPHMYMTFALPLPLGYESLCEAMDLRLTRRMDFSALKDALNRALPPDIRVTRVALQKNKPQTIASADYEIRWTCGDPQGLKGAFEAFFRQPEIPVTKKTKKFVKEVNAKEFVKLTALEVSGDTLSVRCTTVAGSTNFNPTLLTDRFLEAQPVSVHQQVIRRQIYDADGHPFA